MLLMRLMRRFCPAARVSSGAVVNRSCVSQRCVSDFSPPLYTVAMLLVVRVGERLGLRCLEKASVLEEEDGA